MKPILSICIPTYNRPLRLKDSLANYRKIIEKNGLAQKIELCISDNSTNEETQRVVEGFSKTVDFSIGYTKNQKNIGYDGNVLNVLSMGKGEYLHLVSDEDIYGEPALLDFMELMENDAPDCIVLTAHVSKHVKFKDKVTKFYQDEAKLLTKILSYNNKGIIFLGLLSCLIIRSQLFSNFKTKCNPEHYNGLGYVHVAIFLNAIKNSKKVAIYSQLFREKENVNTTNTPLVIAFPSDQLRLLHWNYYGTMKNVYEDKIINSTEYVLYKKNFFIFGLKNMFELRTFVYPELYQTEYPKMKKYIDLFAENYELTGLKRILFDAYIVVLFNPVVPYHLIYSVWAWYRIKVKKNKDVANAHESYRSFLSGKKEFHTLARNLYTDQKNL